MIKISVIVPIYNSELYLAKCLESIVNQSYKNLEIILVNDGSTDSSDQIIQEFVYKYKRIITLQKENGGIGSAYKAAFEKMTGDYISFIDSDDFLELNAYAELIEIIDKEQPDFIHFGIKVINDNGELIRYHNSADTVLNNTDEILEYHFEKLKHPSLVRLFKSSLFADIVIFEQNNGIDEMLTPQLLLRSNKAVYTSKCYYNLLERADSICRTEFTDKKMNEIIKVYRFLGDFLENKAKKYLLLTQNKYVIILSSMFNYAVTNSNKITETTFTLIKNEFNKNFKNYRKTNFYKKESLKKRLILNFMYIQPGFYAFLYRSIKK